MTEITHNPGASRFETTVDGLLCVADYRLQGATMVMPHTLVPAPLEGRGIAAALVREAFAWAETQGYKVLPLCSYVAAYATRHPEVQPLLAR